MDKKSFNWRLVGLILILGLATFFGPRIFWPATEPMVEINGQKIKLEIATSPEEKYQGLSGRPDLAPDQGLVFLYDNYNRPDFVMRGMLFSIDIIWLNDWVVAGWEKNLPLPQNGQPLVQYRPAEPINQVLEVKAGLVDKLGLKAGDKLKLSGLLEGE